MAVGVWAVGNTWGRCAVPSSDLGGVKPPEENAEWTFEKAKDLWKPMTRAVQHVGVPGYEWQTGVLWDGSLLFGPIGMRDNSALQKETARLGNNLLHVSIGYGDLLRFLDRRGTGNPAIQRKLEEGCLPIPHVESKDGNLIWVETVFAHLLGRGLEEGMNPRPEDMLITHALFRVRNPSRSAKLARLWLHFGDTSQVMLGYKAAEGDELSHALAHRFEPPFGMFEGKVRYVIATPAKGKVVWHTDGPTPEGMKNPAMNLIEWQVPLAAHEDAAFHLIIPYGPVDLGLGQTLLSLDSKAIFDAARDFWKAIVGRAEGAITVPDDFVNDYLAAVPGQMTEQIGFRHEGKIWMYKTSPNWYEAYWPTNAAKALPTLDLRGLTRYSRPVLQSFIDTQTDDVGRLIKARMGQGNTVEGEGFAKRPGFMGNFGDWTANTMLASPGLELWALASHYRITRDRSWLESGPDSPLQAMLEAFDWVATQRRRTMREENGRKVAHWGLLPAASAHDWLSGYVMINDVFCIFGMIEAVRLLREINHPRAEDLARELNDYRSCLRDRYTEARNKARRLPMPDGTELPYVPRAVYELDWAKPDWTYTGYGPLRAGAVGALNPNDELVDQSLAFLEAGMPKGEGFYFKEEDYRDELGRFVAAHNFSDVSQPDAPRHFMWRHFVEYETMWPIGMDLFLQRDDLPRFFEWFFNNMSIVVHKEFRVGVESVDGVPSNAPGEGERWRAVRNMFVNELGGYDGSQQSLWLLQAIPRSWLKPGSRLSAKQMGTHFGGQVDLEVEAAKDGNSIAVSAKQNLVVSPTEIRMRLRSGSGQPLVSASVNGQATPVLEKDTIKLPMNVNGEYRIVGRFI
ncbi:MAG: hypothetical protein ABSF71_31010 [Terriglobia bacterium]